MRGWGAQAPLIGAHCPESALVRRTAGMSANWQEGEHIKKITPNGGCCRCVQSNE